jgi:hypothetical protein
LALPSRTIHPLLLDPRYWRERLEIARRTPRQLLIFPRADLSWPGGEVSEFWMRAHDGERLEGLMARSLFPAPRPRLLAEVVQEDPGTPAALPRAPLAPGAAELDGQQLRRFLRLAGECQTPPEARSRGSALEGLEVRFDWDRIRDGQAHLMLVRREGRKLEDRVLDLVRAVEAARRLAELASLKLEFGTGGEEPDELQIARQLFEQGWA